MRFLDLFMVWCVLADAPEMSSDELLCTRTNWNRVILEGRKPGLTLGIGCETAQYPLAQVGKDLFHDLKRVAQTLDGIDGGDAYAKVCDELVASFDDPELTFSARILRSMIDNGIGGTGKSLAAQYRDMLREEPLEILKEEDFSKEHDASWARQRKWKRQIRSRLKHCWHDTPDTKEKGHISVAKYSSLKTGMMITNARLSYIQTRGCSKSSVYFKKITPEVTRCHCWIVSLSIIPVWKRLLFALPRP